MGYFRNQIPEAYIKLVEEFDAGSAECSIISILSFDAVTSGAEDTWHWQLEYSELLAYTTLA